MTATRLRLDAKAATIAELQPRLEQSELRCGPGEALVCVAAAGVNPSDAKAALGLMPHAAWPRTPGRDYAGTVLGGPPDLIGAEVWGSSGDLGIRRDGTHASHLVVEAAAIRRKPARLSFIEAAGIGVPFVTAWEGFCRARLPGPGETVLVMGANGKVGLAAGQIAHWRGAKVIGVARKPASTEIDAASDVPARVRELTGGKGADIVFNTVGDPYFQAAHRSLAVGGRQILIAAVDRIVQFNIFEFYRGRHTYVGIDTLALSSTDNAAILDLLAPGFDSGALRPFASRTYRLEEAAAAYAEVLKSPRERIVLLP